MLSPYRVLDLTDVRGQLAGAMLAWLGADVISIEPPEGFATRHQGPFADDVDDVNASLTHWAFHRGKRSVVLDGHADFDRLVAGADVVITGGELDYDTLAVINPSIILASITPFGLTGPRADWAATDLTIWAAAGPLVVTGDDDRAPVRPSVPQAWAHASAEAAGAIIAALFERGTSGHGQLIDISAQQASAQATQSHILATPNNATVPTRGAGRVKMGPLTLQLLWACKDGSVSITFLFGTAIGPASARLLTWMFEEGYCDAATRDKDMVDYGALLISGAEPVSEFERLKDIITAFCADRTRAELLDGAMERRLLIAPVQMIGDVVEAEQFAIRDYWDEVAGHRFPGSFAKLTATPLRPPAAPPRLGADTAAVVAAPARTPFAPAPVEPAPSKPPLTGVKILDLMWVMAGPATTRVLADLGADIIRIESSHRVETARTLQPFKDDVAALETSSLFANLNAGKRGISVDPSTPEGREIILDLVRWADVVTESFSPKAMRKWGLGYEQLREVNPRIVMLSSCLFGQSGPLSTFAGYGTMAAAMSGFFGVTGWPDRAPAGPFGAYTDYISPRFATATLLAAIDHQRRTGEGQYIDYAQAEGAIHALGPAILEYTVNGRTWPRAGNDDPMFHPHGVFPSAGNDRWVAIACTSDAERTALAQVVGGLDDPTLSAWTAQRSADEAAQALQTVGVASYAVQNSPECAVDPQLAARGHFVTLPHPSLEQFVIEGTRFALSRTPTVIASTGPMLGQHTFEVLTEVLGYDMDKFTELLLSGSIE